jgi:uncharacterized protein YjbK
MKEVEKRALLTDKQYEKLIKSLKFGSKKPERQITTYFDIEDKDIRLM